ncbi:SEC14 cytosolic factor [Folsomia candida]|uniref:SEC14 cytosolic factor n=1 Tax=Folsomia candida TaxID=158441 RepID=A0A226D2S4_FOLCA|nr:SEC14 cytosolic factor [Folsomia candida]
MLVKKFNSTFAVLHILLILYMTRLSSQSESLTVTKSQKQKLDKFKEAVETIKFPQEWMKDDLNLLRYLKARGWDVQRAKDMIQETVKWWKDYGMDNIHNEDWSQYERSDPYQIDGVDKEGKPIMLYALGEWDLRQAAIQGRLKTLVRWVIKGTDEIHRKTRDLFKQGKINGTQWSLIANIDKFNSQQHLSLDSFDAALNIFRPLFTPSSRKALKVFSSNKETCLAYLLAKIDPDQLPEAYGGTRHYD